MSLADVLFWVVCAVLVAAGASKVLDPSSTGTTLAALGLPGGTTAARLLGGIEVVLGIAGLAVGGRAIAVGVAVVYAAFAVIVAVARRRELPSCGCFGARSAPPSPVHVAVNVASAAVAVAAVVVDPVAVADGLAELAAPTAVVVLGLVVVATALVIVIDTVVADVVEGTATLRAQTNQ